MPRLRNFYTCVYIYKLKVSPWENIKLKSYRVIYNILFSKNTRKPLQTHTHTCEWAWYKIWKYFYRTGNTAYLRKDRKEWYRKKYHPPLTHTNTHGRLFCCFGMVESESYGIAFKVLYFLAIVQISWIKHPGSEHFKSFWISPSKTVLQKRGTWLLLKFLQSISCHGGSLNYFILAAK